MTNEELALLVQEGSAVALDELTRQNKGMMHRTAYRLYLAQGGTENPYGMELEDAAQIAFMGLYGAAMAYRADSGYKVLAYLWLQTRRAFRDMYYPQRKDPMQSAYSLDEPLTEDSESFSLLNALPDDSAREAFEDCDEAMYWRQVHAVIDNALGALTAKQGEALRMKFFEGQQLASIGKHQGRAHQAVGADIRKALYQLRRAHALRQYYSGYIRDRAYRATGYAAWREHCGSHMELLIERADRNVYQAE